MKILIEESVLRQALDALLYVENNMQCDGPTGLTDDSWWLASDALRTALDAAEGVEPVAWQVKYVTPAGVPQIDWFPHPVHPDSQLAKHGYTEEPLYTHPAPAVPEGEK